MLLGCSLGWPRLVDSPSAISRWHFGCVRPSSRFLFSEQGVFFSWDTDWSSIYVFGFGFVMEGIVLVRGYLGGGRCFVILVFGVLGGFSGR